MQKLETNPHLKDEPVSEPDERDLETKPNIPRPPSQPPPSSQQPPPSKPLEKSGIRYTKKFAMTEFRKSALYLRADNQQVESRGVKWIAYLDQLHKDGNITNDQRIKWREPNPWKVFQPGKRQPDSEMNDNSNK